MWPRHTLLMLYLTNYHLMFVPLLRFHFPERIVVEEEQEQAENEAITGMAMAANPPVR